MSRKLITSPITSITTKQGWLITLPLADPRGLRRIRCKRLDAIGREIGLALSKGYEVRCPLTLKRIRIYRRGLHRSQVFTLGRLRDRSDKLGLTYLPLETFTGRRDGDLAKLALWGLAERMQAATRLEQEAMRGRWRITPHGRAFLDGQVAIPRQVAVLLGQRIGYVDLADSITAKDVTADFNRDDLEAGRDGAGVA